jgi:hypothetical protein
MTDRVAAHYPLYSGEAPRRRQREMSESHCCPACGRPFKSLLDYPRVRIIGFERLPVPEAMDTFSAEATRRRLSRVRSLKDDPASLMAGGINMTPEIERACSTREVQEYLARLASLVGRELNPHELLPPLPAHGYFKWAYPVPGTAIYLSLSEAEATSEQERVAEVEVHCEGPNMGSAGGPTLQPLGAVARLRYEGLLNPT